MNKQFISMLKSLMLIACVLVCTASYSQELKKVEVKQVQKKTVSPASNRVSTSSVGKKGSQTTTISKKAGQAQVTHDEAYYHSEIIKINEHLDAINKKIEFVNNDPIEKSKATESGWFEDMGNIKRRLNSKKKIYEEKLSK